MRIIFFAAAVVLAAACWPNFAAAQESAQAPQKPTYDDLLYRLARDAELSALPQMEQFYRDAMAEHEVDAAGYSFAAERFGDFLTVKIQRGGMRLATAINLGRVTQFFLSPGHIPDRGGKLVYRQEDVPDKKQDNDAALHIIGYADCNGICSRCKADGPPSKEHHWEVRALLPILPKRRDLYRNAPSCSTTSGGGGGTYSSTTITASTMTAPMIYCQGGEEGGGRKDLAQPKDVYDCGPYEGVKTQAPRAAVDDAVELSGLDAAIYAPAGDGDDVLNSILGAVRTGYEPRPLPGAGG